MVDEFVDPHLFVITPAIQKREAAFLSTNDYSTFLDASQKIFTSV